MARGRLFTRRAVSVPPVDYRLPIDAGVSSKAYLISSHAVQDNDAMRAKSRRNDANFLHDVSSKLVSAQLGYPYLNNSTYVASRYPVPASYPYAYTTYPAYNSYPVHYYPTNYRGRTWYAPPVTDYEVDSYLAGGPSRYYGRYSRGGSVPPALPSSTGYVPRWHSSSSYARGASVPRWTAPVAPKYTRNSLAPYDDVVVGVAHTAQYGDIVIGIPSNKKHLFQDNNNNNHYKGGNNHYKSYYYPSFANRHSIAPSYPTVGAVSVTPSYRRASIAVPYFNSHDYGVDVVTSPYYSAGSRASVAALKGTAQSVQRQLQGIPQFQFFDAEAPAGVTINRPRAASSIPTFRAAGSSVASTSSSVPAVSSAYKGSGGYSGGYSGGSSSAGGSYSGGSSAAGVPQFGKYTKPPVSDTRRKVRDLLCKSKNNPHYFD